MPKTCRYFIFTKKNSCHFLLICCVFGLLKPAHLAAQSTHLKGWSVEVGVHTGHIARHSEKLKIGNSQRIWAQEVNFSYQTWGKHDWNGWQHFPALGVALIRVDFTENAHGRAYGFLPNLTIPLVDRAKFDAHFRFGTGIGWVTKPFDFLTNPNQNAIGSHVNNIFQFRLGGRWRPSKTPRIQLVGGGAFTHFSNGGAHRPNFGLNLPSLYLGAQFSAQKQIKSDFSAPKTAKNAVSHRFAAIIQTGLAMGEMQVAGGPSYPIYSSSIGLGRYFSNVNRAFVGLDYERHTGISWWLAHAEGETDETKYRAASMRWLGWVGDEFLFGPLGVHLQTGVSLSKKSEFVPFFLYNKLAFRYYFPQILRSGIRPWAGIYLKSHIFTAEYISISTGLSF